MSTHPKETRRQEIIKNDYYSRLLVLTKHVPASYVLFILFTYLLQTLTGSTSRLGGGGLNQQVQKCKQPGRTYSLPHFFFNILLAPLITEFV